ncbi:MAG TPA: tetratricopeptide repeat protein [Verrucomicrobiales bacterium]|jgi:Tfp pilus assembly protein PilF|nr:tetratricopeptide repeat protein [Verrucomicrobiales bacterium]
MTPKSIVRWLCLVFPAAASAGAAELTGKIQRSTGETADISLTSDLVPSVGDKVEIFFKIPGGDDEVVVGTGAVTVVGSDTVKVKISQATGTVTKDQLVKIHSANPQKRAAGKPAAVPESSDGSSPRPPATVGKAARPVSRDLRPVEIKPPEAGGQPGGGIPPELMPVEITPGRPKPGDAGEKVTPVPVEVPPAKPLPGLAEKPEGPAGGTPAPVPGAKTAQDFYNEGFASHKAGDRDAAMASYTKAIEADPSFAPAYYNRACIQLVRKNYDGLLSDSTRALDLGHKSRANLFCLRGTGWAGKGNFDKALLDHDQAITLDPNYALAYNNRGNDYYRKGDMNRAMRDCDKSIALDPSSPLPWYNRGYIHYSLREYPQAASDWKKAIELQPDYARELEPLIRKMGDR